MIKDLLASDRRVRQVELQGLGPGSLVDGTVLSYLVDSVLKHRIHFLRFPPLPDDHRLVQLVTDQQQVNEDDIDQRVGTEAILELLFAFIEVAEVSSNNLVDLLPLRDVVEGHLEATR